MTHELDATHYDRVFAASKEYSLPAADAPWAPLWKWLAARIRKQEFVLDLGCGPGHLAELLQLGGHSPERYIGVDFSGEALRQARRRAPGFTFLQRELRHAVRNLPPAPFTAVCCEVLEHITADLELLEALPARTRVLATVPSFDTVGHVRHFTNFAAVCTRYESVIDLSLVVRIGRCFGFSGVRR